MTRETDDHSTERLGKNAYETLYGGIPETSKMDGFRRGANLALWALPMSKGLQTCGVSFTDTHLTHFAGWSCSSDFADQAGSTAGC